jgi:hypothetical protein
MKRSRNIHGPVHPGQLGVNGNWRRPAWGEGGRATAKAGWCPCGAPRGGQVIIERERLGYVNCQGNLQVLCKYRGAMAQRRIGLPTAQARAYAPVPAGEGAAAAALAWRDGWVCTPRAKWDFADQVQPREGRGRDGGE